MIVFGFILRILGYALVAAAGAGLLYGAWHASK